MQVAASLAHHLAEGSFGDKQLVSVFVGLSYLFWITAYITAIRVGVRDRIYTIPLLAICLNITWEVLFGFTCTSTDAMQGLCLGKVATWGVRGEFLFDLAIFYLLLRYGRDHMRVSDLRRFFYLVVTVIVAFSYLGQYSFVRYYQDTHGLESAFIINLVMSVLFVLMAFDRPDGRGLSRLIAWAKMLGTGVVALAHLTLMQPWNPDSPVRSLEETRAHPEFMLFLFASVFVFDFFFIAQCHRLLPANRSRATR